MNCKKEDMLLYAVTDKAWTGKQSLYEQVEAALKGGVTCVQLREKDSDEEIFLQEAIVLKKLCKTYGVPFLINDNVEIAIKSDADGVHVGQKDMEAGKVRELLGPDKIIGVTARTVEQAVTAQKAGADYLGVGAVFTTGTKQDAVPINHETLQEICETVTIPVVSIGGITKENMQKLKGTKANGAALVSAIFSAKDIEKECKELKELAGKTFVTTKTLNPVLTIAGSDCSGGAGIQADLKTMLANGVYGMSAITALTAQNTTGVQGIMEVAPEFLAQQLDSIFADIRPEAVKTGMVASKSLIGVIADKLKEYKAENIVVDPVMVATSGARLISEDAIEMLTARLLPLATVVTPNIPEAKVLTGISIGTKEDMIKAVKIICEKYGCAVLLKGGHSIEDANDLLYGEGICKWFSGKRIDNINTHGTGCTLSSAIASNLAKGQCLEDAVDNAKAYITGALSTMLDLGKGSGPLDHGFGINP